MKAKDERRSKEGGAKRAPASGAVGIAGGEFAPERSPSLKGVGWCRRAIYSAIIQYLACSGLALIYERNGKKVRWPRLIKPCTR